jgi:hypothetical protein
MRNTIIAITAALALGISSSVMAFGGGQYGTVTHSSDGNSGGLIQGSSVSAGSFSGATTTGTGFAGTYGISNMHAETSGKLKSGESLSLIQGTSYVQGHSESGTFVEGAGAAGSVAYGSADAGFAGDGYFAEGTHQHFCIYLCGPAYNEELTQSGDAWAIGGATGTSWAASGSIGDGEGLSVQGFEAYGDAKAKADIDYAGHGEYDINTKVKTSSGALTYTIEEGNAIGQTHAVGWGFAGADAYRVHGDASSDGTCVANGGTGNCGVGGGLGGGNGTGNEGGGQGPS